MKAFQELRVRSQCAGSPMCLSYCSIMNTVYCKLYLGIEHLHGTFSSKFFTSNCYLLHRGISLMNLIMVHVVTVLGFVCFLACDWSPAAAGEQHMY